MAHRIRLVLMGAVLAAVPTAGVRADDRDPTPLEKYVSFDQNYNVYRRKRTEKKALSNGLSAEEKVDRELAYFTVSTKNPLVNFMSSSSLSENEKAALMHVSESGKRYYLLPILKKDAGLYRLCRTFLGPPLTVEAAKKLLGRTTHAAFANDVISEDFFVKWIKPIPGENIHARRALMTNDYLESANDLLPPELKNHVINDVAALELKLGPVTAVVAFRSTAKISHPLGGGTVYPGHGLLGCDECIAKLAAAKGMSPRKWKQKVFLPKLAELTAYSHFVVGAFYETHTQNLLIEVNEKTGDVTKLYIRDLSDVVIDPIIRLARGDARFASSEGVRTLPLIAHHLFADREVQLAREAGMNTATYTMQSIGAHLKGYQARAKDTLLFLDYYMETYSKIFGKTAKLSPKVEAMIAEQKKLIAESKAANAAKRKAQTLQVAGAELEDDVEEAVEDEADELSRGKLRKQMFAEAIQEVFDQGKAELTTDLARKIEIGSDQNLLREKFGRGLLRQEVTFASAESRDGLVPKVLQDWKNAHASYVTGATPRIGGILDQLEFGELPSGQIAAFDKKTGDLKAVTLYTVKKYGWAERWKCALFLR